MDDGSPTLEVGFAIDMGGSFEQLVQLQQVMDSAEAKIVADAAAIERATGSMLNLGGATASMRSFGSAATREAQTTARELARVEKAGEALSRQLERDASVFGKTRDEIRSMKVEAAALAAEQQGLTELAARLRAQEQALYDQKFAAARRAQFEAEAAAEAEQQAAMQAAAARQAEASAAERAAREHAALAAQVRASQAAQVADAEAAERLRMETDPLYAAIKRVNAAIAESTRLYYAGATAPAEYARQQQVLAARLREAELSHDAVAQSARRGAGTLTQLSFQINDVATMAAMGAPPLQIFASQAGQIFQIAQQAEGGLKGFAGEIGGLLLRFGPLIAVAAVAAAAFGLFSRAVSSGIDTKEMVKGLGLTRAEMKRLKDTSVGVGDVVTATFQVMAERVGLNFSSMGKWFTEVLDFMTTWGKRALAAIYAQWVGTFRAIGAIVQGVFAGKGIGAILADVKGAYTDTFKEADSALSRFGADVTKKIASNKLADLQKQAAEIKKDRTPKTDRHAQQLERENEAIEAQVRNLYKLATAYGVSGAAALIAEARTKAESAAIKKRGDVETFVNRQIRLAIAERVADAAKNTAATHEQAVAQEAVNAKVAAGLIPAERAAELVKDQIADLPLLAAIQAAQQRGLATEAARATAALADQRAERVRLREAEEAAQFGRDTAAGADRLAELREELRLIGATDAERVRALATLKATQEAEAKFTDPARRAAYIAQQVEIADAAQKLAEQQSRFNLELGLTADRADELADAMSRAFGRVGSAIGDVIGILGHYGDEQSRIDKLVKAGTFSQAQGAKRTADLQINSLLGITGAAKGLFKEHSKGYQAMAAAEKALTVLQLARTAVDVAGGAARMFATLGPYAFPAVAAMLGVMAALGFGGGGGAKPTYNAGKGTVLGDSDAESKSIARSIDRLRDVDTLTMRYSAQMLASLRNIETSLGGVTNLILRTGGIDAFASTIKTGTKGPFSAAEYGAVTGALAFGPLGAAGYAALSEVPIIGDFMKAVAGIGKALFGTKRTIVGQGISADGQTLEQILNGGFDADYFADVKKKRRFLGVTASTSYSTKTTDADAELERQFGLIFGDFYKVIGAAAGPLGLSLDSVQNKLSGFVVDIGKIDLKDLSGEEIQERLAAVFGAAADRMAATAFPGMERFQQVGEGLFETVIRVASTVEAMNASFVMLGQSTRLNVDAAMALVDKFDDLADAQQAASDYFDAFYSDAEKTVARTAQLTEAMASLGFAMPTSVAGFRALVDAQDLNTDAGRTAYATLLKLAPLFSQVFGTAQDVAEKTANASAEAAKAADELRKAWQSVGDSIMDEVRRIRGISGPTSANPFAALMGQFSAATAAARGGDMDAAKSLPQLSQALLTAAANAATSRQELDRVSAQVAASLEATNSIINLFGAGARTSNADLLRDGASSQAATGGVNDNGASPLAVQLDELREEIARMRAENNAGHAANASANSKTAQILDRVTQQSGGDAIATELAA